MFMLKSTYKEKLDDMRYQCERFVKGDSVVFSVDSVHALSPIIDELRLLQSQVKNLSKQLTDAKRNPRSADGKFTKKLPKFVSHKDAQEW